MENIEHDFRIIVIDETSMWEGVPHMDKVRHIAGVYLADYAAPVHVCSLAPNLEATWIEDCAYTTDAHGEIGDEIDDYLRSAYNDQPVSYFPMRVSALRVIPLDLDDHVIEDIEEIKLDHDSYDPHCRARVADKVIDWYIENPVH